MFRAWMLSISPHVVRTKSPHPSAVLDTCFDNSNKQHIKAGITLGKM